MASPMDTLLAGLEGQGVMCRQTKKGTWVFSRNGVTMAIGAAPETEGQWIDLLNRLRGAGWLPPGED